MSYILDALRKAESQRDRQRVPGLHDPGPAGSGTPLRLPAALLWGLLGIGVLSVGLAVWQLWPSGTGEVVAQAPAPAAPPQRPVPPVTQEVPPAAAVQPAPAPVPPVPIQPPAERALPKPEARRETPTAVPASAPRPAAPASMAAAASSVPIARASAPASTAVGEAPADAPRVAINGGVWSEDARQRMLVVNGQVFNEGAELVPGLVLEQIRPNLAVLRWREQRYGVRY